MSSVVPHDEPVVRFGPTTRPTTLTSGETISFSKGALEGAAAGMQGRYLPQTVEHLPYLPPVGRIIEAWVAEDADGEFSLYGRTQFSSPGNAADLTLPDDVPAASPSEAMSLDGLEVGFEPRNLEQDSFAQLFAASPLRGRRTALHAELPPLIWTLAFGGSAGTSAAFVAAFFRKFGDEFASELLGIMRRAVPCIRKANRESLVVGQFETTTGVRVSTICPVDLGVATSVKELTDSVTALGRIATFFQSIESGEQSAEIRAVAFMWDFGKWRLAWYATDVGSFTTPWFVKHAPDPARFLGRPLSGNIAELIALFMRDGGPNETEVER